MVGFVSLSIRQRWICYRRRLGSNTRKFSLPGFVLLLLTLTLCRNWSGWNHPTRGLSWLPSGMLAGLSGATGEGFGHLVVDPIWPSPWVGWESSSVGFSCVDGGLWGEVRFSTLSQETSQIPCKPLLAGNRFREAVLPHFIPPVLSWLLDKLQNWLNLPFQSTQKKYM